MKIFLFLVALAVAGLIVTGAIKFQKSDNTISIQIDRAKVREEAKMVVDKSREVLREAGSALKDAHDDKELQ
jgi:hypothetical protein